MGKYPIVFHDIAEIAVPSHGMWNKSGRRVESDSKTIAKGLRKPRLFVRMKATNSGVLINRRVYPGPRMRNSVDSWLDHYGRPILSDHPSSGGLFGGGSDPKVFGRVTEAKYTQIVAADAWANDWAAPLPTGTDGSGFITLGGFITDQEAIDGVLDQRLLTMSVGSVPDAFFCSICKQDWIDNGPCGHEFGKHYDIEEGPKQGRYLAYGVTGNLNYDHIAFVNTPADVKAQVLNTELQDSAHPYFSQEMDQALPYSLDRLAFVDEDGSCVEMEIQPGRKTVDLGPVGRIQEDVTYTYGSMDSKPIQAVAVADLHSEVGPAKGDAMSDNVTNPNPEETVVTSPPTEGEKQTEETLEVVPTVKLADTGNWTMPDPEDGHTHKLVSIDENGNGMVSKSKGEKSSSHDHEVRNGRVMPMQGEGYVSRHPGTFFIDENKNVILKNEDPKVEEKLDADLPPEGHDHEDTEDCGECTIVWSDDEVMEWPLTEAEDIEEEWMLYSEGVYAAEDKPLTTKQRKGIPGRLFCGPDRSFPVPDKPRVRNALARLGQGFPKGASSSTKARIRACVMRRAKALGVSVSEGSGKGDSQVETNTMNPQVELEGDARQSLQTVIDTMTSEVARKKAEIVRLTGALEDKKIELEAVRSEMETLQKAYRSQIIDRVIDLKIALKKPDVREAQDSEKIQAYRDEHAKRNLSSLLDSARDLQIELAARGPIGSQISPSDPKPDNPVGALGAAPEGEGSLKDNKVNPKQRTLASLRKDK